MALVAKLIPVTIESALFAFFTGLGNLNYHFLARLWGNLINLYFDVKKENIGEIWKLYAVATVCSFLPILLVWMLPTSD